MNLPISPGTRIRAYCNGYVSPDQGEEKRVIACGIWDGKAWIVAESAIYGVVAATDVPLDVIPGWLAETESWG